MIKCVKKLSKLIEENPDVPVIAMVDSNIVGGSEARYLGGISGADLVEIALLDGIAYYKEDKDDLIRYIVKAVLKDKKKIVSCDELEAIENNAEKAADEMYTKFIRIKVDYADVCDGYNMLSTANTIKDIKKKVRLKKFGISVKPKSEKTKEQIEKRDECNE